MHPFLFLVFATVAVAEGSLQLPMQFHKQEHELSCEAAALTMVLRSYGVQVDESEVIRKMPFDHTRKKGGVWGDPDSGFVGDIDGVMGETGYGIYWNALARLASQWKKAAVLDAATPSRLIAHLDAGRPVIVWGNHGPAKKIEWKTPEGRTIQAWSEEHTGVVYGYQGKKEDPQGFWVMDPQDGPHYLRTADFLSNWDSFGRKGVVLYR